MTTPDFADFQMPSAIASSIANGTPGGAPGGVPLLHGSSQLGEAIRLAVTPSSAWNVQEPVVNISYELYLDAICLLANTSAQMTVALTFSDQASGLILDTRTVTMWPAAFGASVPQTLLMRGPCVGNQVAVNVFNNGASGTVQVNGLLQQSGRIYPRHFVTSRNMVASASTRTLPDSDPQAGLLATNTYSAVASAGSKTDQLPPYQGRAYLAWHIGSGLADGEVQISAADDPEATINSGLVFDQYTDATGQGNQPIVLPGVQCFLTITNHNASSRILDYTLTSAEY